MRIRTNNQKGYETIHDGDGLDLSYPESKTRRGRVCHGLSHTLTGGGYESVMEKYRIRKLTPRECWRLMGFSDEDFDKAQAVNSNSQLYKQAGNSIVVNVLMAIFNNLKEPMVEKTELSFFHVPQYIVKKPVRLIELFAGIGSQAKALENLGWDFETYRCIEWDRFRMRSYNAVHGTSFETSDICTIGGADLGITDTDKFDYIMTYSFPCQDLSIAGKGKGMKKGEGTRSGLLWEVERLLNETEELPQILLMENVPQVHSKKNLDDFEKWMEFLESKGYSNFWEDLNRKNYGIPQNRNRCFMVSILGDYDYEFPKPVELKLCLGDMLEDKVDEKFYLNEDRLEIIEKWQELMIERGNGFRFETADRGGTAKSLTTNSDRPALTTWIEDE